MHLPARRGQHRLDQWLSRDVIQCSAVGPGGAKGQSMQPDDCGVGGIDGIDDADAVLPPPPGAPFDPDDQLWHTASFAAIADARPPQRKRKLTAGLACLGAAATAMCTYAGVELAGFVGLNPPSPPRYVVNEQANGQQGDAPQADSPPALPEPPPTSTPLPHPGSTMPTARDTTLSRRSARSEPYRERSDSDKPGHHRKKRKSDD